MSFVHRFIAGARDLGGSIGALLARVARHIPGWHQHDSADDSSDDPRRRIAFTIAVIALSAKIATADGVVTRDEVAAFGEVFRVVPGASANAIREAYYRLVRANHPDLVIAQGLLRECIALATARVARINAAYGKITKGEAGGNDQA